MPAIAAIMGLGVVRKNPYFSFRGLAKTIDSRAMAAAVPNHALASSSSCCSTRSWPSSNSLCQPPERKVWILPHDAKPHDGGNGGHARDDSWTDGCNARDAASNTRYASNHARHGSTHDGRPTTSTNAKP